MSLVNLACDYLFSGMKYVFAKIKEKGSKKGLVRNIVDGKRKYDY